MANNGNLIPQAHVLTVEEASRGGIASGKARAMAKTFKKAINDVVTDKDMELMIKAIMKQAKKGNTRAFEVLRDTRCEKPKDEVGITIDIPIIRRGENELKQ